LPGRRSCVPIVSLSLSLESDSPTRYLASIINIGWIPIMTHESSLDCNDLNKQKVSLSGHKLDNVTSHQRAALNNGIEIWIINKTQPHT
jgi:hypothetical protein